MQRGAINMKCWDCDKDANILIELGNDYDIETDEGSSSIEDDKFAFCKACYLKRYKNALWSIQELDQIKTEIKNEKPWYQFW